MVRGAWLVWFSVLPLRFVALTFALLSCHLILLEGAMALLLQISVAVAVETGAGMERLGVHREVLEASVWRQNRC